MEKSQDFIGNDCSVNRDLKKEVLENSSLNCVSDKIVILDKAVEDTNCNLTLLKSPKNSIKDKQSSISTVKDKPSVISLHVGPNGLINGLEVDTRPGATLNHLLEQNPESKKHENLCTPSSSHTTQNLFCETSSVNTKFIDRKNNERTDLHIPSANLISESSSSEASLNPLVVDKSSEICNDQSAATNVPDEEPEIKYVSYLSELQMPDIMRLIQKDLSEPYSIYTYRYFIHNWPKLCFLAMDGSTCVGAIVCKLDTHRKVVKRGYIAMLAVDEKYRKRKIGSNLVLKAIRAMVADDADEVVLETEITNRPALRLYENLGFVRDKRLFRYYLNGVDALRLKLWLR